MQPDLLASHEALTLAHDDAAKAQPDPGLLGSLPLMLAILAIFYFLLIRPQQKEAKAHRELLSSLKKGDDVVTAGGLHGRVYEVREHDVVIEVADKVKVQYDKVAIKRKIGATAGGN